MKLLKLLACTMLVSTAMVCAMDESPVVNPDDLNPGLSVSVNQLGGRVESLVIHDSSQDEKPSAAPLSDSTGVPSDPSTAGSEGPLRRVSRFPVDPGANDKQQRFAPMSRRTMSGAVNPSAALGGFDMLASHERQPSAMAGLYGSIPTSARSRRLHAQEPLGRSISGAAVNQAAVIPDAEASRSAPHDVTPADDKVDAQFVDDNKAGALSFSAAPFGGRVISTAPSRTMSSFGGRVPSGSYSG